MPRNLLGRSLKGACCKIVAMVVFHKPTGTVVVQGSTNEDLLEAASLRNNHIGDGGAELFGNAFAQNR